MWHEIVNDEVEGVPIAVTFCPLCNTVMVFDARVNGETLTFGVSGKLRFSDMIMDDRETQSGWQQAVGEGIVGRHMGVRLRRLPARMISWAEFRAEHPDGRVMDEPAWNRDYGTNPYAGYDSSERPFLYDGENPPHGISPLARVVRVGNRAWTLSRLRERGTIQEAGFILTWTSGQASALDADNLNEGADVGTVRVTNENGEDIPFDVPFAFAFHAFHPDGIWMLGEQ